MLSIRHCKTLFLLLILALSKMGNTQVTADTVFAAWDFAEGLPAGWTENVISSSGFAHWEYRGPDTQPSFYVGARGSCAALSRPIQSYSQSNGFMIFDANYWDAPNGPCAISNFGTGPDPFPANGYVAELITNPIDLSMAQGVFLSFNQQFRTLNYGQINTRVKVYASTDDNTWTEVYSNGNTNETPIVQQSFVNLTSTVNGQSNVKLKFSFEGNYYWWQLDDIIVYQPFANDIAVKNPKFLSPSDQLNPVASEYDQYPVSMPPLLTYSAEALNAGYQNQNAVKAEVKSYINGTLFNTFQIPPTQGVSLTPLQTHLFQASQTYSWQTAGHWDLIYRTYQIENDNALENNRDTLDFDYTPFVLAKDEGPSENHFIQPEIYSTLKRRDGNYYKISGFGSYCHGLQVGFDDTTPSGTRVVAKVYSVNSSYELVNAIATSDTVEVNGAFINFPGDENLMTIHFDTPAFLSTGQTYCFTVEEADSTRAFGIARSGRSREGSSAAFFDVYTDDVFFVDTNFIYTDTTFIITDTIFSDNSFTIVEYSIDSTLESFTLNFDTNIVRVSSVLTSDKSFLIRGLLRTNELTMGCTDNSALNFSANAAIDDSSCYYTLGCALSIATNFNPNADFDDGTCIVEGCTDSNANNFLVYATINDNSCIYPLQGCTNPLAGNYNPEAEIDNGTCLVYGCTDLIALNYEASANADDGNCLYLGCLDSNACNFTPDADVNGGCTYAGCNDPVACNYDIQAGCNDSSCCYDSCYHFVITFSPDTAEIPWVLSYDETVLLSDNREQNVFTCYSNGCGYSVHLNSTDTIEFLEFAFIGLDSTTEHNTYLSELNSDTTIYFSLGGLAFGCTDIMATNYNSGASCEDGSCITPGCTDYTAYNYLINATIDDSSCVYAGCLDILANNYADSATIDNGSCLYFGCTDSMALNFDPEFNFNDGSCIYPATGCTNPFSENYNPLAQIDDGSCIIPGCTNPNAINFNINANTDNNTCLIPGCIDSDAANYDPVANFNDGSCQYSAGCTLPTAINFDSNAVLDDGSCLIAGCTNNNASNYNPTANLDDGSCILIIAGCTNSTASNFNPIATIDDSSCVFGSCMNPDACNYDSTSNTNDYCIYPGYPCNDGSSLTGYDVITSECQCEGQISSQFGCTDFLALNYNLNASYDDGSCVYSAPNLTPTSTLGCSPLNLAVFASTTLPTDFNCQWLLDDVIIDSTCNATVNLYNLAPAIHEVRLVVSYINPFTGTALSDTSITQIDVIQGAELPLVYYDSSNSNLICSNCQNQIQWFYNGLNVEGNDVLFVATNGIVANGQYQIIHTGTQGCISDTTTFVLAEALLLNEINIGCSPVVIDATSPILLIDGMTCNLLVDEILYLANFVGSTEITLTSPGTHSISQVCNYGDSVSASTFSVDVFESSIPDLFFNTDSQLVTCTNANLFDSIAWVADGVFIGSENSVSADGIYFSCTGYGPGTCQNQNTININTAQMGNVIADYPLNVYPIPAKDIVTIAVQSPIIRSTIIDMQGKKVAEFSNSNVLDLSLLSPGLYNLIVETKAETLQRRIEIVR